MAVDEQKYRKKFQLDRTNSLNQKKSWFVSQTQEGVTNSIKVSNHTRCKPKRETVNNTQSVKHNVKNCMVKMSQVNRANVTDIYFDLFNVVFDTYYLIILNLCLSTFLFLFSFYFHFTRLRAQCSFSKIEVAIFRV